MRRSDAPLASIACTYVRRASDGSLRVPHPCAQDPLFVLYTSGSTGKPKGVLHSTGGYMIYAATTSKYVFDLQDGDTFFCTADCGWITGHSYVTYGPMLNRATQLIFEGVPSHPDAGRLWRIADKYGVTQLYTAPTAIRALMRVGDDPVTSTSRASLRLLGSVGEPINPEAWRWYYEVRDRRRDVAEIGISASISRTCRRALRRWWARSAARSWTRGGRPRLAGS